VTYINGKKVGGKKGKRRVNEKQKKLNNLFPSLKNKVVANALIFGVVFAIYVLAVRPLPHIVG
jgi:hypothetical protein